MLIAAQPSQRIYSSSFRESLAQVLYHINNLNIPAVKFIKVGIILSEPSPNRQDQSRRPARRSKHIKVHCCSAVCDMIDHCDQKSSTAIQMLRHPTDDAHVDAKARIC